jgi:hypothetical protein
MKQNDKTSNKLEAKGFVAERVDENTIKISRKKKNNTYEVDMYVFSAKDITELKAIKTSGINSDSFFSRITNGFKIATSALLFFIK